MTLPHPPLSDGVVLDVVNASRRWGSIDALSSVSLTIGSGEIFALIGPNGAGKTTLVRAITGRVPLHAGTITILGEPARRSNDVRRHVGLVPQALALYPHLTAQENLEVFGRLAGLRQGDVPRAVQQALARVHLTARAMDRTSHLSGGMQRRLNIAAGTLHNPTLLLLDEPTVGVDIAAREAVHDVLRTLRRDGMAVLLTTHDLDQAQELADRVGVLSHGRLLATDSPEALIHKTFDGLRELVVILQSTPDDETRLILERDDLRAMSGGKVWSGPLRRGLDEVSELGQRLETRGVRVEELRVREPSLRSVFVHLTGESIEP